MLLRNLIAATASITPYGRTAMVRGESLLFDRCDPKSTTKCVTILEEIAEYELFYPAEDILKDVFKRHNEKGYSLLTLDKLEQLIPAIEADRKMHWVERSEFNKWLDAVRPYLDHPLPVVIFRR